MTVRFPISVDAAVDLVGLVYRQLQLSKLNRRETMVVFTDTCTNPNYASAFLAAGKELAASVFEVKVPTLPDGEGVMTDLEPVLRILRETSFVADLSTGRVLFLYSKGLADVLKEGTRVLQVRGSEDQLRRCFPCAEVRKRTIQGAAWLEKAQKIRVTSRAGTNLTMSKAGRRAQTQYGMSDVENRWDSWPSGFLYCAPVEETVNGVLVLDVGDLLVMLGRYVAAPVSLHVEKGRIVDIEGGVDAKLLQERLELSGDAEAFVTSHIGWGTDSRARWTEVAERGTQEGARDARSVYGNIQIAFGANYALGGKNTTAAHEDLIMRKANLYLDEAEVVCDGVIVPEELK